MTLISSIPETNDAPIIGTGSGEIRTLLDTYVGFNNGGISIDMIERRSSHKGSTNKQHQMQISISNMGQEINISVPLVPSMAKTFELLAQLVKEHATEPRYLAPMYNDVTCGPIAGVDGYYDAQGNKVRESWGDCVESGSIGCESTDNTPKDEGTLGA